MNEPLVCEDTDLDRLLASIRTEHGDAANILYQDSVRRGGVMGFFAQEVHRIVYRIEEGTSKATGSHSAGPVGDGVPVIGSLDADDLEIHPFQAMLDAQASELTMQQAPIAAKTVSKAVASARAAAAISKAAEPVDAQWLQTLLSPAQPEASNKVEQAPVGPIAEEDIMINSVTDREITDEIFTDFDDVESEHTVVSYSFPKAEPTVRPFNQKGVSGKASSPHVVAPPAVDPRPAVDAVAVDAVAVDAVAVEAVEPAAVEAVEPAAVEAVAADAVAELTEHVLPTLEPLKTTQERFDELMRAMSTLSSDPVEVMTAADPAPAQTEKHTKKHTVEETEAEAEATQVAAGPAPRHAKIEPSPTVEPAAAEEIVESALATEVQSPLPANGPTAEVPELSVQEPTEEAEVVTLPATGHPDARARLDMLMRLREVGVPAAVNPTGEAANIYEALDEILSELPATPTPPRQPGEVLVIIGDIGPALRAAQSVARTLRLRDADIWVADLDSHPALEYSGAEAPKTRAIANPRHASRVRAELVSADVASVVVIATDGAETNPNDPWISEMLEALRPTAVWACVDATRKTSDTIGRLSLLGELEALVVYSAAISSSPASVWDIGVPVALLDGNHASMASWAGLLLGLIATNAAELNAAPAAQESKGSGARHRSA